jgi:RNA polymerase primary sigma factor
MNDFLLQLYLRDLASNPQIRPMTPPSLESPTTFDDSARERLVLGHLPNVVRMAFDYRDRGVPLSDLINEGNIGLMRAAELFDPFRNVHFAHYARLWIRTQMDRAVSYQSWAVSLPADFSWRRGRVHGAEERLTAKLNRKPDDSELAESCGLELPAVRRLRTAAHPSFLPLEAPCPGAESDVTLAEVIADENMQAPDREVARRSDREFVTRLVNTLAPMEQKVIRLRYGLDGGCGHTLQEVGQSLGYVRQGIHRIETAALAKLRQHAHFLEITPAHLSTRPKKALRKVSCKPLALVAA